MRFEHAVLSERLHIGRGKKSCIDSVSTTACSAFFIRALVVLVATAALFNSSIFHFSSALAQSNTAQRLQNDQPNQYREAKKVSSMEDVKNNMKELYKDILLSSSSDGAKDKWYSPHLRDIMIGIANRVMESVFVRGQAIPRDFMINYCMNPWNPPILASCPNTVKSAWTFFTTDVCLWHGEKNGPHRPALSCFVPNSTIYRKFINDNNWKTCCVRKWEALGIPQLTSEWLVSLHPKGDGWAGLMEVNYPVTAFGWENDRSTTMIADQQKVQQCIKESDPMMENEQAQEWVAKAIQRNIEAAGGNASGGKAAELKQQIAEDIRDVRPKDKKNRFADNLNNIGLTARPHLAALDPAYRRRLAKRFCGWPNQFDKLMTQEDLVQEGGGLSTQSLDNMPMWANYCPKAVAIMTKPEYQADMKNLDGTPTRFDVGMAAWTKDKLYCQKKHLTNPNLSITGFDKAIKASGGGADPGNVGFTCLDRDNLNAGMVPLSFTRNSFIERRTAIADQAIAFLIAAGIAPGMHSGQKSYLKRFEPQPYSMSLPPLFKTFIGKRMQGAGTNELILTNAAFSECQPLSGEDLQFKNKADRLYISNKTHEVFTQKIIDERNNIDKYVQDWADQQKEKIAERGLDDKSLNYGTAFRIVAMCPSGMVRWRPPEDDHGGYLRTNTDLRCQEEYFGGIP